MPQPWLPGAVAPFAPTPLHVPGVHATAPLCDNWDQVGKAKKVDQKVLNSQGNDALKAILCHKVFISDTSNAHNSGFLSPFSK